MKSCADCGVTPGRPHDDGCDVARCLVTGLQRLACGESHDCGQQVWTGRWPGDAECEEFGWQAVFEHGRSWVCCTRNTPGAVRDLNRLYDQAVRDSVRQRWVRT